MNFHFFQPQLFQFGMNHLFAWFQLMVFLEQPKLQVVESQFQLSKLIPCHAWPFESVWPYQLPPPFSQLLWSLSLCFYFPPRAFISFLTRPRSLAQSFSFILLTFLSSFLCIFGCLFCLLCFVFSTFHFLSKLHHFGIPHFKTFP